MFTFLSQTRAIIVAASLVTLFPAIQISVAADFYVDPDWSGVKSGSESNPWSSLTDSAWNSINQALLSDNVTVYFSAREAYSTSNETSTVGLKIGNTSNNRLTIDGISKYNTDDLAPSWQLQTLEPNYPFNSDSNNRFQITSSVPIRTNNFGDNNNYVKNITIRGFTLIGKTKIIEIGKSKDILLEQCDLSASADATNGPGVHIDNSSFNNNYNNWSENITISHNNIHDTYGEALYVNGHKTHSPQTQTGQNITIKDNNIYNAGTRGGQGDGIDIKDGVKGTNRMIIMGNHIYDNPVYGIVTDSGGIFKNNFIYNNGVSGMSMATIEAEYPTRADSTITDNVIVNNKGNGIEVRGKGDDPDNWTNLEISRNIIANNTRNGISLDPNTNTEPTVILYSNILLNNGNFQLWMSRLDTLKEHDDNIYGSEDGNNYCRISQGSASYGTSNYTSFEAGAHDGRGYSIDTSTHAEVLALDFISIRNNFVVPSPLLPPSDLEIIK